MITATKQARPKRERGTVSTEQLAREALANHSHFHGRADEFRFELRGDVLTVRGRVPSFYLNQVLQTVLKGVDGVRLVDNQVDVVRCDGLSSVRRPLNRRAAESR